MGLNVKVALLISLGFIGGMCWLVNQIGRSGVPLVESKAEASSTASSPGESRPAIPAARSAEGAGARFAKRAPVEQQLVTQRESSPPLEVQSARIDSSAEARRELPPLHVSPPMAAAPSHGPTDNLLVARAGTEPDAIPIIEQGFPERADGTLIARMPNESIGHAGMATAMPVEQSAVPQTYRVQKGDSLSSISKRLFNSDEPAAVRALLAANPRLKARANRILVGEEIAIPSSISEPALAQAEPGEAGRTPTARKEQSSARKEPSAARSAPTRTETSRENARKVAAASGRREQPDRAARSAGANKPAAAAVANASGKEGSSRKPKAGEKSSRYYTVRPSDSLQGIAQKLLKDSNRWREIAELNQLRDANKLIPGKRIKLPADARLVNADT